MKLTVGRKISLAMSIMFGLVAISALIANLSVISIQRDVSRTVESSSPLLMATQAMIAKKTRAGFELNKYILEDDPEKLSQIEKRYVSHISDHDKFEQKICEVIQEMPLESHKLMQIWREGMETVMPEFNEVARRAIDTHRELLRINQKRLSIMNRHGQIGEKLLDLLAEIQESYADVDQVNGQLMKLKTVHAKLILVGEEYLTNAHMLTDDDRLRFRKEFAIYSGTFLEKYLSLKKAATKYNGPQKLETIFTMHTEFVDSAIGQQQLFDLYEKEILLHEKEKKYILAVGELETADLVMAGKLLELTGRNLTESGTSANDKANAILKAMVVFFIFALLVSVFVMASLSKRIVRPVLALSGAASQIAAGDLDQKIDVSGTDEIGDLCRSFNCMSQTLHAEVTIRKKAENERTQLLEMLEERNRELQNVVYVASHDLRSPLVTINGFSEELGTLCREVEKVLESEKIDETVKQKITPLIKESIPEDLRFINAGAEKMKMLIGGLLQISRAGSAEVNMKKLEMNEMLKNICQAMQYELSSNNIEITVRDLPPCYGDETMINQVFSNLLDNAVKYRKNDGQDRVIVTGWLESGSSVYCVEDNGVGISPGNQSKIFEIFHRLDPHGPVSGEGLGLTIINRILDRHSGRVWVESEPGVGSKFFVSIPSTV